MSAVSDPEKKAEKAMRSTSPSEKNGQAATLIMSPFSNQERKLATVFMEGLTACPVCSDVAVCLYPRVRGRFRRLRRALVQTGGICYKLYVRVGVLDAVFLHLKSLC
jgi:hypothetical protein